MAAGDSANPVDSEALAIQQLRAYVATQVDPRELSFLWVQKAAREVLRSLGIPDSDVSIELSNEAMAKFRAQGYALGNKPYQKGTLIFGRKIIWTSLTRGINEYKSLRWMWPDGPWSGDEGLRRLVLHECAHVIQAYRLRGSAHNASFMNALCKLLRDFPLQRLLGMVGYGVQDLLESKR